VFEPGAVPVVSGSNGAVGARGVVSRRKVGWLGIGAIGVVLSLVVGVLWALRSPSPPAGSPGTPRGSAASPRYDLAVNLRAVQGKGPTGIVAKPGVLAGPAAAVERTITQLYDIGFVDPVLWADGRFPSLAAPFAPEARQRVRAHVADLSLGEAAARLEAVRPTRARLDVRFMLDRGRHPIMAFAHMDFAGVGQAEDAELPIRHQGDYALRRTDAGWRIVSFRVKSRVPSPRQIEAKVREASLSPELASSGPLFVLVIGSDARPRQSIASGTRGDAIHIVAVNPRRGIVSILGIPRDSYVSIPRAGTDKINAALALGGPELMVRTVEKLTGIHIDAYVLTGFAGFERMVKAVGGFSIDIPYAMDDSSSGAHFRRGPTHLSGRQALALARDRHDAPGGDFGRSMNQGRIIVAAMREFQSDLRKDPLTALRWGLAAARFMKTDLSLTQMMELLLAVPSFARNPVRNAVVYGSGAMVGSSSVIRLGSFARAKFRDLRTDAILRR
jgi:polyisoprenyl-teichoic acid--peptidoglycan teichoic acid transferase